MADRKDFFCQMAAQYRQLGEIASNPEIKQRMLDMAAHYQAKADEDKDAEQSSGEDGEGATRARA
jgi:negative regulator of replication initiation